MRIFMHKLCHFVLTGVMLWLAYLFIEPEKTFTTPGWSIMARMMTEEGWGFFCLAVAFIGAGTMFTNNWNARTAAAGLLSMAHLLIAALVFMGNPHGAGSGLFFGYAVLGAGLAYSTAHLGQRVKAGLESADISGPLAR